MPDVHDDAGQIASRHGWTIGQRIRALDSYGLLLLLILLSLIVSTLETHPGQFAQLARIVFLGGTLAFALHTSGAPRSTYLVCAGLVVVAAALLLLLPQGSRAQLTTASISAFLLVVAVLGTILRRFRAGVVVTGSSILAAVCIYLLVGLAFSAVYGFLAAVDSGGLFVGAAGDGNSVERIYFSYVTLATVGYGDFVMASDVGRMIAVTEGLLGQIYLVTIVSLLVANLGARRRRPVDRGSTEAP
jgi:hypothetical protein